MACDAQQADAAQRHYAVDGSPRSLTWRSVRPTPTRLCSALLFADGAGCSVQLPAYPPPPLLPAGAAATVNT